MIIDIVLVTTTLAIGAVVSYALWKARRRESSQIRRVIGLALYGAASITLAKLVQLAVLTTVNDAGANLLIVRYAEIAATIVVAVGVALLAISLLDMIMMARTLWPKQGDTLNVADICAVETAEARFAPGAIPALLFRRTAPLLDTKVASVFLNNKAEDLLGFTREEMQSDPHFIAWLMHPEDRQEFVAGDVRLATDSEAVFDHRLKHSNGSYRWIRTILKRLDDESGNLREIVGCGLDITDLKEAEKQLTEILSTDPCSLVADDEVLQSP